MKRVVSMLLMIAALELALGAPALAQYSSQPSQSLGDIARALRAKKKPELPVITNDNLSHLPQLIRETEQRDLAAGLAPPQPVNRSQPEITCSFGFDAQAPSAPAPASSLPQDLPSAVLSKLNGPAVISGDTLQVSLYNGSSWDVQEITVGVTVIKHENQVAALSAPAHLLPASAAAGPPPVLKKPDETFLYHLKGSAPPLSTTAFTQLLGLNLSPSDEWHWAILQARGIPPATPAVPAGSQ